MLKKQGPNTKSNSSKKRLLFLILSLLGVIVVVSTIFLAIFFFYLEPPSKLPVQQKTLKGAAWFRFNNQNSLDGWEEKIFKGKVVYSVKSDEEGSFLNAYSKNTASGIIYWLNFNPRTQPMVSWKWRVIKFPEKKPSPEGKSWWLEKDDYAARFYIIFPRFPFLRYRCIEYVWDKEMPAGKVLANPNFKNLKIIVAESGEKNLGHWVSIERNIYKDYRELFDSNPGNAGAIAIMTDSENTQSEAEAQYNDIEVGYEK